MDEMKGLHIIKALRRKWISYSIFSDILISAGAAFLLAILAGKLLNAHYWWGAFYFLVIFTILFFMHRVWRVNEMALARLLNQTYLQLEESSGLLLQPLSSLNLLERLQFHKTGHALSAIPAPLGIVKKIIMPALIFVVLLAGGLVLNNFPFHHTTGFQPVKNATADHKPGTEKLLSQIAGVTISIKPPAYTDRSTRQQHTFNLEAEEGAIIEWQLKTNTVASQVKLIFNDTSALALHAQEGDHTKWHIDKKTDSTGFYQVNIDGRISGLYKIEIIKDLPPVVLLQSPKQYTTIDIGEPKQVKISSTISDDYGIKDAAVIATIASGSGEAVKFKEQKLVWPGFAPGKTQYQLQQLLLLPGMGMQPGDELYFYVQATDNRQQQTRSDVYFVRLPDTAQLMSLDGMANSLTMKPEYFRSQRQIIIETEQLLKDKDTISEDAFKNRSNNLAIDQKLLRLRYGKFLGDENESGENDTHELEDLSNFSNAEKLKDAYTDKHDNAEDATFYDPGTKKQLRATLAEMWNAEMRLHTFTPQTALPFEYKALRLLKDLQQKSRAYVAKTNLKTATPDLNKRLTGDPGKIKSSILKKDSRQEQDALLPVRNALSVLEQIRAGGISQSNAPEILQQANLRLHEKAIQQPARYLPAAEAMKKIMDALHTTGIVNDDILVAEQGLQQLVSPPARLPSAARSNPGQTLSKQYFDNLQKKQP